MHPEQEGSMLPEQAQVIRVADELCDANPEMALVRDQLLEMASALTGGEFDWDPRQLGHVNMYQISINSDRNMLSVDRLTILTQVVRYFAMELQQPLYVVLDVVARCLATPDALTVPPDQVTREAIRVALHEPNLPDGWQVHGLGMTGTSYSMREDHLPPGLPDEGGTVEFNLRDDPNVLPVWFTHCVTRPGHVWTVIQQWTEDRVYGVIGPDEPVQGVPESQGLQGLLMAMTDT